MAQVFAKDGTDVTHNYKILCVTGELIVTPHPITVQSPNAQKTYDGAPIACGTPELTAGELMNGHTITYVPTCTMVLAGKVFNTFAVEIKDAQGRNVTHNYTVTTVFGELTVFPRKVTVRTESAAKDYDGEPLVCDEWEVVSHTNVLEGHTLTVVVSGTRTEPGQSDNLIAEILVVDGRGQDVSRNYDFSEAQYGLLIVRGTPVEGDGSDADEGTEEGEDPSQGTLSPAEMDTTFGFPEDYGEFENVVVLKVHSETDGHVYLKSQSFGSYTGNGWSVGSTYNQPLGSVYSMDYLMGLALKQGGLTSAVLGVDLLDGKTYVLPYYMDTDEREYVIQTSDTMYQIGDGASQYSLYYYTYDYLSSPIFNLNVPSEYAQEESDYYEHVKQSYLDMPTETRTYMEGIIAQNGFSLDDPYVLGRVTNYIRGAATYNLEYDRALDSEADVAVEFLKTYKEGICQHYAAAATLLIRALGIPARYTVGYAASTVAGEWADVTMMQGHAWVEVYIQGAGWIQIEVTAGMGEEPEIQDPVEPPVPPEDEEEPGDTPPGFETLVITPVTTERIYNEGDGILTPTQDVVIRDLLGNAVDLVGRGYSYQVSISGELRTAGKGSSTIDQITIFDANDDDVTNQFDIVLKEGVLRQYLKEITITSDSAQKIYDGLPLLPDEKGYIDTGLIAGSGHVLTVTMTQQITDVGEVANQFKVEIQDEQGNDVSELYKITTNWGTLKVVHREITVQAKSDTKIYDGTALKNEAYDIVEGELCNRNTIEVVIFGSQTNVGRSDNVVKDVKIYSVTGIEVTKNYSIKTVNGVLFVSPF